MRRLRRFLKETSLGALLAFVMAIPMATPPGHVALIALGTVAVSTTACGPNDLTRLNDILLKTAKTLDTAIDTNGQLYEGGFYGKVGSPEAVAKLHRGAQLIKDSALHLKTALTLAKGLTNETFEKGKLAVLHALTQATASMETTGSATLDLVLQSVSTLITQAVAIVQLFQSSDVPNLRRVTPQLDKHIRQFERIMEVSA